MKINGFSDALKNKPKRTQSQRQDGKSRSGCLFIDRMRFLYKLINVQYYIRDIGRCSSTVEHGFRKAGVVGPIPTIGCVSFQVDTFRLGKFSDAILMRQK